jgi:dipeptidyl aminopeptidase/acylaminoacyl peptidase
MIKLRVSTTLVAVVSVFLCVSSAAQQRRAMAPNDILRVANVSDAQIHPGSQYVVYTVSGVDEDRNFSTLWIAPMSSAPVMPAPPRRPVPFADWPEIRSSARPLLPPGWSGSNPRWSPDGSSVAFLSRQDDQEGIFVIKVEKTDKNDKLEPKFVAPVYSTNFFITYAGELFAWSPDSKRITYISARAEPAEANVSRRPSANEPRPNDPRVIDRIQYKSRTSFSDDRRTHVWLVEVERERPVPLQLTSGAFYDHAVTFSPRGDEIAYLSNHESDPDANNNSDIFAVDFGGQTRQITMTKGCEFDPAWSPDGKMIAYTATKREITTIDSVAEDAHLWVVNATGGNGKELSTDQDRRVRDPRWSLDSRTIFYLAGDRGSTTIFKTTIDGGRTSRFNAFVLEDQLAGGFDVTESTYGTQSGMPRAMAQPVQITSFSFGNKQIPLVRGNDIEIAPLMAITVGHALRPAEVWLGGHSSAPMRRISAHNDALVRGLRLVVPEEINYSSFDGTQIQGWLMRPAGCSAERKCPLILSVHGGPHGMFGCSFNAAFQVYAARGYAVLYVNPRGSSGYGQKFSDGTINEWGGGDYRDLMAGVDEALRKNPWIDGNRMGVTGGSYGGFMTNWIITQTPRFRGAVASASVSNLISFYSTSLYQDLIHAEFGGFPWDNYELLWQWSPLRYVRQVQTPTLFIHGENDNDVHITQAEEMYMGLKRRGVETVFVRYPREGHGLREPRHRVDALERTINWFDRFVKGS